MPTPAGGPKIGDYVWYQRRHSVLADQPNGQIIKVSNHLEEVVVKFLEYKEGYKPTETLPLSDFDDTWTDKFGGLWRIDDS